VISIAQDGAIFHENVGMWIVNVRGGLRERLAAQLNLLKLEAQVLEEDVSTPWRFCGSVWLTCFEAVAIIHICATNDVWTGATLGAQTCIR